MAVLSNLFSLALLSIVISLYGEGAKEVELRNCPAHSPLAGLKYTYDGTTGAGVLSTICHNQELNQTFSLAPSSAVYNISSPVDLTSGCLNKTVVSELAWRSSEQQEREIEVTVCSEPPPGCALEHCSWSRWLNKPRQNFSVHSLPKPWVLRSLLSHSVRRSHRYKLEICHLSGFLSSNSSCHLPHIPHGTIRDISHTHSITQSHTPFRIKIGLSCDNGYREEKSHAVAVCEEGIWDQLPHCQKCDGVEYCDDFAPVITTDQLSVGFVAGSNLTLNCEVRGNPPPSMSWHRVLPNGVREPLLDHTHFLHHQNGSVTVLNISDMESGPYVCWAWNRVGSDIAYIHLYNSHPDGTGAPSIHHWSPLHVVTSSPPHSSHLHCHTQGFPPPTITWSHAPLHSSHPHNFHPITSTTISQHRNGTLTFDPVRNADTAIYRCEATNLFGTVSMETILFVSSASDEEAPVTTSTNWIDSYNTSLGARLELSCPHTLTSSHPHTLWMKKGGLVSQSGTRVWQLGNGTLVIDSVVPEDEGPYWCVVWNETSVAMEMTRIVIIDDVMDAPAMVDSVCVTHHHDWFTLTLSLLLMWMQF